MKNLLLLGLVLLIGCSQTVYETDSSGNKYKLVVPGNKDRVAEYQKVQPLDTNVTYMKTLTGIFVSLPK